MPTTISRPNHPGVILYNGQAVIAMDIPFERLISFVISTCQNCTQNGSTRKYDPDYMMTNIMRYLISGSEHDFTFITSDQGLNQGVRALRLRLGTLGEGVNRKFN